MTLRPGLRPLALLADGLLACPASAQAPPAGFVGPFEAGLRWIHPSGLASPWIPTRAAFGAGGELVWAATGVGQRSLRLLASAGAGAVLQPEAEDAGPAAATWILEARAADDPSRLYSLAQYPEPDDLHRRTVVARHDALGGGASLAPSWSHAFSFTTNGPAALAVDDAGEVAVAAALFPGVGVARVARLSGADGALLGQVDLNTASLEALALSGDGAWTALALGPRLVVLDAAGVQVLDEALPASALALDLDHAGQRLVVGLAGELRVYERGAAGFTLAALHAGDPDEVPTRVALSRGGEAYGASWWRFQGADRLRHELYASAGHLRTNHLVQEGVAGGLQNSPSGLALSADGSRAVFASWGRGDAAPEVVLVEAGAATPLLAVDLPGSALAVDLDPAGTRVVVAAKDLHANQLGTTGDVRLYDTGERDLELLEPARLGGHLRAATRRTGSSFGLFLVGRRREAPVTLPGIGGLLHLDRGQRLSVLARPAGPGGRADLDLPLPAAAFAAGQALSIQAAHRVGGALLLGETVVTPLIR